MGACLNGQQRKENALPLGDPQRLLFLGLDKSGKTSILYRLGMKELVQTFPTLGFNNEKIVPVEGVYLTVWDVGGEASLRKLWRHYYQGTEGLVFVVDSTDHDRMTEAREELHKVLSSPEMSKIPTIVIANKQDLPNALKASEISDRLGLNEYQGENACFVLPASAVSGEGLIEAMVKMSNWIKENKN